MNIIQSFWTGNKSTGNPLNILGGWPAPEYYWLSWALSCLQLNKIFGKVELITDSLGKEILVDILHLPFSKASIELDNILNGYPNDVWALAKIHSYSIQEKPFIHFDGDFFLWQSVEEKILNAELLVQNKEMDLPFYKMTLDQINQHFKNIPDYFKTDHYNNEPIISINAGVIGGTNLDFFQQYRSTAFDFINSNIDKLSNVKTNNLNFVFEQLLFFCLAKKNKIPITSVSDKVVDDLIYGEYVNFSKIPNIHFIHPVGGHKQNIEVCDNLSKKMRMEYPLFYESILDKVNSSGLSLFNKVYFSKSILVINKNSVSNTSEGFIRTIASIRYLLSVNQTAKTSEIINMTAQLEEQEIFQKIVHTLFLPERDEQLLLEIYEIEKLRKQTYALVFKSDQQVASLCLEDAAQYEKMQRELSIQNEGITQIKVIQNKSLQVIIVKNNWTYNDLNKVEEIVNYNFRNIERTDELMVFVPQIIRMEVDEFLLDTLDTVLFNFCLAEKPVSAILKHAETFFDQEEVIGNYGTFYNLIIGSIIRLSYLNILRLNN
jgi:hypothetical protein